MLCTYHMGYFWSSPDTLSYLKKPLLGSKPELNIRSADLLLVSNVDFELNFDCDIWSHVAMIFMKDCNFMVLHEGHVLKLETFLQHHSVVFIRYAHCPRPSNFETLVCDAVNTTIDALRFKDNEKTPGVFCVAYALALLQLASLEGFTETELRPAHFSHDSPIKILKIDKYSENYRLRF